MVRAASLSYAVSVSSDIALSSHSPICHKRPMALPPPLATKTEAINWLQSMIRDAEEKRFLCADEHYTGAKGGARKQRKAYRTFLIHYGNMLGTAGALFRTGWITEGEYEELHAGILNLMLPTTTEMHVEVPRDRS